MQLESNGAAVSMPVRELETQSAMTCTQAEAMARSGARKRGVVAGTKRGSYKKRILSASGDSSCKLKLFKDSL